MGQHFSNCYFPLCEITFNKDSDGTRLNFANELAQLGVLVLAVKNSFDLDDLLRHGLEFIRRLNKSRECKTVHPSSACRSESIMESQRFRANYGITSWQWNIFELALCESFACEGKSGGIMWAMEVGFLLYWDMSLNAAYKKTIDLPKTRANPKHNATRNLCGYENSH